MKLWTVGELNVYLKDKLENDHVLANLWVTGEISNYKRASSGHMYFTLKDAQSCVKAVMFSSRARSLLFQPENGAAVRVRGYVSLYERDGIYQLYVQEMEPDGLGADVYKRQCMKYVIWLALLLVRKQKPNKSGM